MIDPIYRSATHVITNFPLDDVHEDVEERDGLDHHGSVPAWEDGTSESVRELRNDASGIVSVMVLARRRMSPLTS